MTAVARRILVPVDFESGSRRAVRYARALASSSKGEICLLHVVPMPPGHAPTPTDRWWLDLAERTLAGVAERGHLPAGTCTHVVAGAVPAAIAKYASENDFDLLILSGRSQPDWHGSLLGTTAAAILRHARVPVLIVPSAPAARKAHAEDAGEPTAAAAGGRRRV